MTIKVEHILVVAVIAGLILLLHAPYPVLH